jgi:hypothetical protein
MKKLLFVAIASLALFSACKKKDVEKTTAEKVVGVWKISSIVENDFYAGTNHFSTYNGVSGDYYDFRTDGKVYIKEGTYNDVLPYSIISDVKLKFDGLDYDIKTLNDNQFVMYVKDVDPVVTANIYEATYTFTK